MTTSDYKQEPDQPQPVAPSVASIEGLTRYVSKLRAHALSLLNAATTYAFAYMQDEAEDAEDCVCGEEQHDRAKAVFAAIQSLDNVLREPDATQSAKQGAQPEAAALVAESLALFDLLLEGCNEPNFGDYENGHGETIGPRMDALHARLRAFTSGAQAPVEQAPVAQEVTQQAAKAETADQAEGEQVQWRNIQNVVRELADFCFGSADASGQISIGAAHVALSNSLTAKDGLRMRLDPLPQRAALSPLSEPRIVELYRESFKAMADRLREPPKYVSPCVLDFARAIESEVASRFRAQGGNTKAESLDFAPTTSTVSATAEESRKEADWARAVAFASANQNVSTVSASGALAHPELTTMFLLNAALCIEGEGTPEKRTAIIEKLGRIAEELRAATTAAQAATDKSEDSTPLVKCAAARDGDCSHKQCPQLRDNEPRATGRHCPIDTDKSED